MIAIRSPSPAATCRSTSHSLALKWSCMSVPLFDRRDRTVVDRRTPPPARRSDRGSSGAVHDDHRRCGASRRSLRSQRRSSSVGRPWRTHRDCPGRRAPGTSMCRISGRMSHVANSSLTQTPLHASNTAPGASWCGSSALTRCARPARIVWIDSTQMSSTQVWAARHDGGTTSSVCGGDQGDRSTVGVAEQIRRFDAELAQQTREDRRLTVQPVGRPRSVGTGVEAPWPARSYAMTVAPVVRCNSPGTWRHCPIDPSPSCSSTIEAGPEPQVAVRRRRSVDVHEVRRCRRIEIGCGHVCVRSGRTRSRPPGC